MERHRKKRRAERNVGNRVGRYTTPQMVNPYPWMSFPEALVHLELERRGVPFSWRWFDGIAPTFQGLMPSYTPEFTLREYKLVILVQGSFFGFLSGVIDNIALASVLLQADGWKVVILNEDEIRADLPSSLDRKAPELVHPMVQGPSRPNPFGHPDSTHGRAATLRSLALHRRKAFENEGTKPRDRRIGTGLRRRRGNGTISTGSGSPVGH